MTEAEEDSFGELQKQITVALVQTTKSAGLLANEDLGFLRTSNPELTKTLDKQKSRLLTTVRRLVRCAVKDTELKAPSLSKAEDVEDGWEEIVEIIDNLLEKADTCLDEYSGAVKQSTELDHAGPNKSNTRQIKRVENITKPQRLFANPPQNDVTTPFTPILKTKPHAIISLAESIVPEEDIKMDIDSVETVSKLMPNANSRHPYTHEIKTYRYPQRVYASSEPIVSQPYESTSATWVDTIEGLHEMLSELKQAREIAVDLEHHDFRTYIGLVSLMQISTREKDWVIDTLKPWREELQVLNEVFADPNIVKVLHGAQMDIIWLQRDLGLYVVGLFDTYHAARCLGYVKHSLAFLLSKFVNFDAQKQYQLADWRARPLSDEMFNYARSDTHFLLYIYDNMRNELLKKANGGPALVDEVLESSKKTALQRYERTNYDPEFGIGDRGWYQLLVKTPAIFNKEQFSIFKAVHQWRDQVARREDESPAYLMSNASLFNIARDMPSNLPKLQSHLNRKSDVMSSKVSELLKVIQDAKARGTNGPDMNELMSKHPLLPEYLSRRAARREAFAAKADAEQTGRSVAEIANLEILSISGDNLRAENSVFWGTTMNNMESRRLDTELLPSVAQFQVPLPNFTAEVFAVEGEIFEESTKPLPLPEHAYVKSSKKGLSDEGEEVFTLKDQGGSRKRKHRDPTFREPPTIIPGGSDMEEADSISIDVEDRHTDIRNERKRKRQEKRRAKREQKFAQFGAEAGVEQGNDDEHPENPFDYASAPSVLNAKHSESDSRKAGNRAPVINPYAKSMDAPKGLPKKKKEIQGKSTTFGS